MVNELMPEEENKEPEIVPLWSSDNWTHSEKEMCHSFITCMGCLVYVGAIAEKGYDVSKNGITLEDIEILMEYSEKPDVENIGILFDCHFYDPDTGKNYRGGDETAKTKCESYFYEAIGAYDSTDLEKSFKKLGKALHFIQDVNEPHHAANITAIDEGSTHSDFEKYVSLRKEIMIEKVSMNVILNNSVLEKPVGDILRESAQYSKSLSTWANTPKRNANINVIDENWEEIGAFTLVHSIRDTALIIYKWMKQTNHI